MSISFRLLSQHSSATRSSTHRKLTADNSTILRSFDSLSKLIAVYTFLLEQQIFGTSRQVLGSNDATRTPPANARMAKPAGRAELSAASHPAGQAWAVMKQPRSLPTGPAYHCIGRHLHGVPLGDSMTISCICCPSSVAATMVLAHISIEVGRVTHQSVAPPPSVPPPSVPFWPTSYPARRPHLPASARGGRAPADQSLNHCFLASRSACELRRIDPNRIVRARGS